MLETTRLIELKGEAGRIASYPQMAADKTYKTEFIDQKYPTTYIETTPT